MVNIGWSTKMQQRKVPVSFLPQKQIWDIWNRALFGMEMEHFKLLQECLIKYTPFIVLLWERFCQCYFACCQTILPIFTEMSLNFWMISCMENQWSQNSELILIKPQCQNFKQFSKLSCRSLLVSFCTSKTTKTHSEFGTDLELQKLIKFFTALAFVPPNDV